MSWWTLPETALGWMAVVTGGAGLISGMVGVLRTAIRPRRSYGAILVALVLAATAGALATYDVVLHRKAPAGVTGAEREREVRELHTQSLPTAARGTVSALPAWLLGVVCLGLVEVRLRRSRGTESRAKSSSPLSLPSTEAIPAINTVLVDRRTTFSPCAAWWWTHGLVGTLSTATVAALVVSLIRPPPARDIHPVDPLWDYIIAIERVGTDDLSHCRTLAHPLEFLANKQRTLSTGYAGFEPASWEHLHGYTAAIQRCTEAQLELALRTDDPRLRSVMLHAFHWPRCAFQPTPRQQEQIEKALVGLPSFSLEDLCSCWGRPRFSDTDPFRFGSCLTRGPFPWEGRKPMAHHSRNLRPASSR